MIWWWRQCAACFAHIKCENCPRCLQSCHPPVTPNKGTSEAVWQPDICWDGLTRWSAQNASWREIFLHQDPAGTRWSGFDLPVGLLVRNSFIFPFLLFPGRPLIIISIPLLNSSIVSVLITNSCCRILVSVNNQIMKVFCCPFCQIMLSGNTESNLHPWFQL